MPKNQCDGCRRGLRLIGGIHYDDEGYPVIGCTKEEYQESNCYYTDEIHMQDSHARLETIF